VQPVYAFSGLAINASKNCKFALDLLAGGEGEVNQLTKNSTSNPRPPGWWGGGSEPTHQELHPRSQPSASNFCPWGLRSAPIRPIPGYTTDKTQYQFLVVMKILFGVGSTRRLSNDSWAISAKAKKISKNQLKTPTTFSVARRLCLGALPSSSYDKSHPTVAQREKKHTRSHHTILPTDNNED